MQLFPHRHHVRLTAGADGYAEVATAGAPLLTTAPVPQFDGPGDAWSPEHLLLASVEASFLLTFRAAARQAHVSFQSLELDALGTVHRMMGVARFAEIVLRPTLRIADGVSREVVTQVLSDAARSCIVTASLSTPVRVEPAVIQAEAPLQLVTHAA